MLRALTFLLMTAAATTGSLAADLPVPAPEHSASLAGTGWVWVRLATPVEEIAVDAPDHYTLQFGTDGRLVVRADCNRGSASYKIEENRLTIGPMALTRAMCPPGSHSDRFARDLGNAASFFQRDGKLFIELPVDSGTYEFKPFAP